MTLLQVEDLEQSRDLDEQAYKEVCGGFAGFLSGLFAVSGGGFPGITNNYFMDIDVTQNIVQQNPVNLTIGVGEGATFAMGGGISIAPVNAASPVNLIQGGPTG